MFRRFPHMLALKEAENLNTFIPIPDWRYRIDFLLGEKSGVELTLDLLEKPDPSDHKKWFKTIGEAHRRYRDYAQKYGDGMELVGKNNIAEVSIKWEGTTKLVGGIGEIDTSFRVVNVDLLPAPPLFVKIDDEVVQIGAVDRGTNMCSKVLRNQHKTTVAAHNDGADATVFETVVQTNWWRLTDEAKLVPLTRFTIPMADDDQLYPKPTTS
jgi:hypothetical protein